MNNIAIVSPNENAVSETFIHAHCEMLKGNIYHLYGGYLPDAYEYKGEKKQLWQTKKWYRLLPVFIHDRMGKSHLKALENFLVEKKIALVLAEYGPTGVAVLPACKKAGIPLIVHFHGFDASIQHVLDRYKKAYADLFAYAHYIIAVSKKMQSKLLETGALPGKIIYNVYGPRPAFFNNKPDYEKGFFLSVGRFVEKKAPFLLLLAFKQLHELQPHTKLVMVGDGPLLPVCKTMAASLGLDNHVTFTGALEHEAVLALFAKAYCFVQHSVVASNGDSEGTPVAILEAGAAALPVVATTHAGIPDVVIHGKTGYLVEEGNIHAMVKYMEAVSKDEGLRVQLGTQARAHIASHFSLQRHIDSLDALIDRAIQNKV